MDHLQTEQRNPASMRLDEMSALEIARLMNAEDAGVAPAVGTQLEAVARGIDLVADALRAGGRLVYIGAGTSGRLGVLDATECPPTFQSPPEQVIGVIAGGPTALTQAVEGAEDRPEQAELDLKGRKLSATDVVVGIATSGRTPYVIAAMEYARRIGSKTVGISCNSDSNLSGHVDVAIIPVVGPEVLTGSTRLKAGTATKLVLNMLTTGAMVRLGKTYGNLMVDLKATNAKLRARTNRIVRTITGLSSDAADELLKRCDGELKTALVVHEAEISAEEARTRLQNVGGQVRRALCRPSVRADFPAYPELVLGIDGGGSHTLAYLADAQAGGRVLGRGEAGPSNIQSVGVERALQALDDAIARAFSAAGKPRGKLGAAALGLAGVDRAEAAAVVRDWAARVQLSERLEIANDATLLLAAGTPEGWGLAVIAGTGSIAFGRTPDGRFDRSGGWGYLLGDEGSAYGLALAGVRAVARAADGCAPPTRLTSAILAAMGLAEPLQMIHVVYQGIWDRARIATLAPLVLRLADQGDTVARAIVGHEANEIANTAAAVVKKLNLPAERVPVAITGGALLKGESYRQQFLDALRVAGVNPEPVALVDEPAQGAVRIARKLLAG
jgi:N-acetylmuramic acid 6-phosphate etherase